MPSTRGGQSWAAASSQSQSGTPPHHGLHSDLSQLPLTAQAAQETLLLLPMGCQREIQISPYSPVCLESHPYLYLETDNISHVPVGFSQGRMGCKD